MRQFCLLITFVLPLLASLLASISQADEVQPVVRLELETDKALVGQPLSLRVTVLVPTWMPAPPEFPSFESPDLITRLPERATTPVSERIGGETWSGVSRRYRLIPMSAGPFTFVDQRLRVTYSDPIDRNPVTMEVAVPTANFLASVPNGAEALEPLIVATDLTIEQSWGGPETVLREGEAVTRTITMRLEGSSALFLPPVIPQMDHDAVTSYPQEPTVSDSENRGNMIGERTEQVTYVARYGGELFFPEVTVEWFDIAAQQVKASKVEGRAYRVDAPPKPREPVLTSRRVAGAMAFLFLASVLFWGGRRWITPLLATAWQRSRDTHLLSERYAAKQVVLAIRSGDLAEIYSSYERWRATCPTAERETGFENALITIGRASYGGGTQIDWLAIETGFQDARAKRAERLKSQSRRMNLPKLNPF